MEDAVPVGESQSAAAAVTKIVEALKETPCGPTPAAADRGVWLVEGMPSPRCTSAANSGAGAQAGIDFSLDPVSR
jgi:hypothetical protein